MFESFIEYFEGLGLSMHIIIFLINKRLKDYFTRFEIVEIMVKR